MRTPSARPAWPICWMRGPCCSLQKLCGRGARGGGAGDAAPVREAGVADLLDARPVLIAPEALRGRRRGAEPEHRPPGLRALTRCGLPVRTGDVEGQDGQEVC